MCPRSASRVPPPAGPIEPSLFQIIHEVADEIIRKPDSIDNEFRGSDRLAVFLENFIAQFATYVLRVNLQGLSGPALDEWVQQRRRLESQPGTEAAQRLMFALQRVFTLVSELSYGAADADLRNFRVDYVPEVLALIVGWVDDLSAASPDLIQAVHDAERAYNDALEAVT